MTFCLLRQQDYDNSCLDLTDSGMTNMYVKGKRCVTIVVIGNVDSGKSTTAGHLLYLKGDLDKSGIVSVFEKAKKLGKDTYKYAWVLDKMKAERKSGNTINAAYGRVDTTNYDCTLIDVPGKPDYLKNTLFGISQADCALLIIDSTTRGFQAGMSSGQTRKHALFAFTLGVKQIICCFNKMDSTIPKYSKTRYEHLVHEVSDLLLKVGFEPHNISFVPISGFNGDNMIEPSANLPWYKGVTLFDAIDKIGAPKRPRSKPLRLPLSDVYNIGEIGTVAVGRVESGVLNPAMAVTFGPTGQTSTVRSVQKYHRSVFEAIPGDHVGFHVDVSFKDIIRGHVASNSNEDPAKGVVSFTCHVIIMNDPGQIGKGFTALMDCHTSHVPVYFGKILSTVDRLTGEELECEPDCLTSGDSAKVEIIPTEPVVVESFSEYPSLGSFILRDKRLTVAIGIVTNVVKEQPT